MSHKLRSSDVRKKIITVEVQDQISASGKSKVLVVTKSDFIYAKPGRLINEDMIIRLTGLGYGIIIKPQKRQ